jgi:hypothetical protein
MFAASGSLHESVMPLESLRPSCPAKAGHPVITENLVVTGSPAFAGDDDKEANGPTKTPSRANSAMPPTRRAQLAKRIAPCSETHSAIRLRGGRSVSVEACRIVAHSWLADAGCSRRISSIVGNALLTKEIAALREIARANSRQSANSARHEWRNALCLLRPTPSDYVLDNAHRGRTDLTLLLYH